MIEFMDALLFGLEAWTTVQKKLAQRALANKVVRRMMYVQLGQAWRAWRGRVREGKDKRTKVYRAAALMLRTAAAKAFRTWVCHVEWKREKRQIIMRCRSQSICSQENHAYCENVAECPKVQHCGSTSLAYGQLRLCAHVYTVLSEHMHLGVLYSGGSGR